MSNAEASIGENWIWFCAGPFSFLPALVLGLVSVSVFRIPALNDIRGISRFLVWPAIVWLVVGDACFTFVHLWGKSFVDVSRIFYLSRISFPMIVGAFCLWMVRIPRPSAVPKSLKRDLYNAVESRRRYMGRYLVRQGTGSSQRHAGIALAGKFLFLPGPQWLLFLMICTLATAVAFVYLDVPIAHRVYGIFAWKEGLGAGFASAILLGIEAAVALALIAARITRGHLSPFREATVLACLTSICTYAINDSTLKLLFGVPDPAAVLHGARHIFNLLNGSSKCSFPSGHMVLAAAFAGVFMRLYRTSIVPLSALLLIAAALLIVGDWHFVSDVVAGTFIGVSAGLLAGKAWQAHSKITIP